MNEKIKEETIKVLEAKEDPVDLDFNKQLGKIKSPPVIDSPIKFDYKRRNVLTSEAFRSTVRSSLQNKL